MREHRKRERGGGGRECNVAGVFDKVQAMSPPAPARVDRVGAGDAAIYRLVQKKGTVC